MARFIFLNYNQMLYQFILLQDYQEASKYYKLTFPFYYRQLQACTLEGNIVGIAIKSTDRPIALALAEIKSDRQAEILSIFVEPSHRKQGLGTALLWQLLEELKKRHCNSVKMVYITGKSSTLALEGLLKKLDFTTPEPRMLVCKCDRKMMLEAPCLQKEYPLPRTMEIVSWLAITSEEKQQIQDSQTENPWIPEDLVPFKHEKNLEPLNSLGIRYQNRVVGWIITHRLQLDRIRYTCSFIKQNLQKRGLIIPAYFQSIKLQAAKPEISKAIWTVPYKYKPMINFVKKNLAPYMVSVEESRGVSKRLSVSMDSRNQSSQSSKNDSHFY